MRILGPQAYPSITLGIVHAAFRHSVRVSKASKLCTATSLACGDDPWMRDARVFRNGWIC